MVNNKKTTLDAQFKRSTSIGEHGEILYDCPMEIKTQADLDNYGIQWSNCRTLNFNGCEKVTVFFMKVESRALAEYQWSYLNTQLFRKFAGARCMISGTRNTFIKCPTTNSCASCPFDRKPEDKQVSIISWDGLIESGYEPSAGSPVSETVEAKMEYESIRDLMNAEDPCIAKAFEMKVLYGFSVKEIAQEFGVSESHIYQLVSRAKAIGRQTRISNK